MTVAFGGDASLTEADRHVRFGSFCDMSRSLADVAPLAPKQYSPIVGPTRETWGAALAAAHYDLYALDVGWNSDKEEACAS